ncbi:MULTISPECIES: TrkH family potassium uptake protein [unclassified Paenibacillus]|uniref:TrkH family potassium uptake protein n=1 Tax=unclassified Paenibacillus TaxID=185978 RepID=UPI002F3EAD73
MSEQNNTLHILHHHHKKKDKKRVPLSPPRLIISVFAILIAIGTILLASPFASGNGQSVGLLNALFTAVSAICVNGLVVVDTGTAFSMFGQIVIMILIQIGGLGFMTFSVMVAILLGKKISLKQRLIIQQTTQSSSSKGLVRLSLYMILISLTLEVIGTIILTLRWSGELGLGKAFYYGLFHTVSSFNNAGFSLWSDSLSSFVSDPVINITIVTLFVLGGIGYIVIVDIFRKRSWRKLSLHTKVVLITSAILSIGGFLIIFMLESWNKATFGDLNVGERLLASFFQGLTPRSAGFNTIDIGSMLTTSQFVLIILMFIGASSGGTGGGVKTNTIVVILLATLNTFRGGGQIHAFGRKISQDTVLRALAVVISSLAFVLFISLVLTITEDMLEDHFLEVLFETTSAFSTTGLSMGLTNDLSPLGKFIVAITMFIGRLGPLTLAFALSQKKTTSKIGYPEDNIMIG